MKKTLLLTLFFLSLLNNGVFAVSQRTEPFVQEIRTFFREQDGLSENSIKHVICIPNYGIIAMTYSGTIQNYTNNQWQSISNATSIKPSYLTGAGNVIIISDDKQMALYNLDNKKWEILNLQIEGKIIGLHAITLPDKQAKLYIICDTKIISYGFNPESQEEINGPGTNIFAIATGKNGELALGTKEGIYSFNSSKSDWTWLLPEDNKRRWAPRNVKALTFDMDGNLWFGSKEGVGKYDGKQWILYTGSEGLPWNEFLSATAGEKGDVVWFATTRGAIRHEKGKFAYRFSHRWLLNDHVNSIAVEPNGNTWLATPEGLF